ncbi:hypothetical protein BC332_29775 [Capsicum chinense]|nr:hypothetical protein BC332_29775 [Capsicum chinense]
MAVVEEIIVGGNYMGVWEEGPNYWKWKSSSKETVLIPLPRNSSYDDMVRSVIESGELNCEPKNVVISYVMKGRGKIHSTFIKNDWHVFLYMLDIIVDGSRPLLKINTVMGSPTISSPQLTFDEHDLFEDESLDAHPMDSEDHSMELEDPIFSEKTFFFEKMKSIVVDGPDLCFISDKHKSITNDIARAYNHAHHGKFELIKIPCAHVMAALRVKYSDDYDLRVYNYSSPVYKVEEYLLAYSKSINVVPLEFELRVPQELLDVNIIPPLVVTKLGRKKKNALRAWVRLSIRRRGTSVQCARDLGTREPLVTTTNRS